MKRLSIFVIVFSIIFCSCKHNDDDIEVPVEGVAKHTFILYLGIDNNFSNEDLQKTYMLSESWESSYNAYLLIFVDPHNAPAYIARVHTENYRTVVDTVKTYTDINSADPKVFKNVISYIVNTYPAETYGMSILSHGLGWTPYEDYVSTRNVIYDQTSNSWMSIPDLANAFPIKFDYLVLDACLMANVEIAYELKEKVHYLISSCSEVVVDGCSTSNYMNYDNKAYGFIYPNIINRSLTENEPDVKGIAEDYYNHYNYFYNNKSKLYTATVSVVDIDNIEPLAQFCKENIHDIDIENKIDIKNIQRYDVNKKLFFDFKDVIDKILPDKIEEFNALLNNCIIYNAYTPSFRSSEDNLGTPHPITTCCGLSMYIQQSARPQTNIDYQDLRWYQTVFK